MKNQLKTLFAVISLLFLLGGGELIAQSRVNGGTQSDPAFELPKHQPGNAKAVPASIAIDAVLQEKGQELPVSAPAEIPIHENLSQSTPENSVEETPIVEEKLLLPSMQEAIPAANLLKLDPRVRNHILLHLDQFHVTKGQIEMEDLQSLPMAMAGMVKMHTELFELKTVSAK